MLYKQCYRFVMAEKGGVRRMSTRSNGKRVTNVAHEAKWRKSQVHFECFTNLIGIELEDHRPCGGHDHLQHLLPLPA